MWLASIVPVRSQRTAVVFALMLAVRASTKRVRARPSLTLHNN